MKRLILTHLILSRFKNNREQQRRRRRKVSLTSNIPYITPYPSIQPTMPKTNHTQDNDKDSRAGRRANRSEPDRHQRERSNHIVRNYLGANKPGTEVPVSIASGDRELDRERTRHEWEEYNKVNTTGFGPATVKDHYRHPHRQYSPPRNSSAARVAARHGLDYDQGVVVRQDHGHGASSSRHRRGSSSSRHHHDDDDHHSRRASSSRQHVKEKGKGKERERDHGHGHGERDRERERDRDAAVDFEIVKDGKTKYHPKGAQKGLAYTLT
ncbi:hypothetical protein GGS20DRAFT_224856 [Poronia punctata]|nr:hypothetical protein GGS20DRAFT_224856 [Poronia punctata]